VLTEPDERTRFKKLVALSDGPEPLPASVAVSIDHLIEGLGHQLPDVTSDTPDHAIGSAAIGLTAIGEAGSELEPEPEPSEPVQKTDRSAEAKRLAAEGDSAYKAGKRNEAERLYQRSLALDGNNLDALIGLHRLSFDRGDFKDALTYAKQALALRPKRGDLNLYVGDACMKVLDYGCARTHYEQANTLGNKQAVKRLRMLDERLGKLDEGDP
jgi:tetratricopeptide (TPR) repeat protein